MRALRRGNALTRAEKKELLEHRWAIPLRDAVQRSGGETLADAWVHPDDLTFYGAMAAVAQAQTKKQNS